MELHSLLLDSILNLEKGELFSIKFWDSDFLELLFRLAVSFGATLALIKWVYKPTRSDSDYVFTFLTFNPLIFFVCHLFNRVDLSTGFAFGLFAVFSILRYRTADIQIKEMTYLFATIALAVINALATKKVSYAELLFTNSFIIILMLILERTWLSNRIVMQNIEYDKIENIRPENHAALLQDLKERTGYDITRFDIVRTDFMRDIATIKIYYNLDRSERE